MTQNVNSNSLALNYDDTVPSALKSYLVGIIQVVVWVAFIWLWGSVLNITSGAVSMALLTVSMLPMCAFFWKQPEYGLITLMFFASGFLEPDFVDVRLPIAGGFEMRDILLLFLLGMAIVKQLIKHNVTIPMRSMGLTLVVFFLFVVFSLFKALFLEDVPSNWALSDARILSFYLIFFIVAWTIKTENALFILILGSFVIADTTAIIVLLQQRLGAYSYLIESMNDGSWEIWETAGAVRVVPPGIVYMYFMNLISIGLLIFARLKQLPRMLLVGNTLLLSIALLFTFTRSAWVASGIALLLMFPIVLFTFRRFIPRILLMGAATLAFSGASFTLMYESPRIENEAVQSLMQRFESIFTVSETVESNSLQWRLFEIQEATEALREQLWTGVGLGNSYRPLSAFQGEANGSWTDDDISTKRIDRFTRYVHTSYLALAVKLGIPALIILIIFMGISILKGISIFATLEYGAARGIVLAITTGVIGLLQWSVLHAHLMLASSTAVIGLVLGMIACIDTIYIRNTKNVLAEPPPSRTNPIDELKLRVRERFTGSA